MDLKIKIDASKLTKKINAAKSVIPNAMPQIVQEFVKNTPIRSGNAKQSTRQSGPTRLKADYQYATVLNDGRGWRDGQMRGSVQAPNGMLEPTKKFAIPLIQNLIRAL